MTTDSDLTPIRGDECTCLNCTGTRLFPDRLPCVEVQPLHPVQAITDAPRDTWCTPEAELGCDRPGAPRCGTCPLTRYERCGPPSSHAVDALVYAFAASRPIAPAFPLRMMVVGHGRHGKDSVGDILRDRYGARFV